MCPVRDTSRPCRPVSSLRSDKVGKSPHGEPSGDGARGGRGPEQTAFRLRGCRRERDDGWERPEADLSNPAFEDEH